MHAERASGLEVDAEIVEEHRLVGRHAGALARDAIERRLGLAHADLARLDDVIDEREHLGDLGGALAVYARAMSDGVDGLLVGAPSRPVFGRHH